MLGLLLQPPFGVPATTHFIYKGVLVLFTIPPDPPDNAGVPVRPLPNLRLVGERSTRGSLIFNIRPAVSYRPKFYNLRQYFVHTCAILCAPPEYHH